MKRQKLVGHNYSIPGNESLLMMTTVVDEDCEDSTSIQFTTVPFKMSLMGPITNVDSTGKLPLADVLEKLNSVELTINSAIAALAESEEKNARVMSVIVVSFSRYNLNLQSRALPAVVHINSS